MKAIALLGFLGLIGLPMQAAVTVEWINPDKFIDAKGDSINSAKRRQAVLDDLHDYIVKTASRQLGGYDLLLKVTNLDIEGMYEPWQANGANDVRVIKDSYPAHIDFSYVVKDSTGTVVKEGGEGLSSIGNFRPFDADSTYYAWTKQLLKEWIQTLAKALGKEPVMKAK